MLTTPFSRKFVAWGLLVCLLCLVWGALVTPLSRWVLASIETRDDLRFARMRALAAGTGGNTDEAGIAMARQQLAGLLLAGAREADAAAQLQSSVSTFFGIDGLRLDSVQAMPATTVQGLTRLSLEIGARGPEATVVQLLSAVESAPLLLVIERAALRNDGDQVALEMTVSGFWLPGASTPGARP